MKEHAGDKPPPQVRILVTTNGRMSDKASIQDEAKYDRVQKDGRSLFGGRSRVARILDRTATISIERQTGLELPDRVFVDLHGSKSLKGDAHWAAELMPWDDSSRAPS
jgi:hypothetical protein